MNGYEVLKSFDFKRKKIDIKLNHMSSIASIGWSTANLPQMLCGHNTYMGMPQVPASNIFMLRIVNSLKYFS